MATGKVKWFNNQKGYGFICADDSPEEIFAHFSSIVMEGYKTLKAGQTVDFDINEGPKGLHALDIKLNEVIATSCQNTQEHEHEQNQEQDIAG